MTIGDNIRKYRKQNCYTQAELAKMSGIATISLQQYELGKRNPATEQLIKIADALKVDINVLLRSDYGSNILKVIDKSTSEPNDFDEAYRQSVMSSSVNFTDLDIVLVKDFHKLNQDGQRKLLEYLSDLLKVKDYTK